MDAAELDRILTKPEDLHTEFKLQEAHPDDLAAALVAFANTDGGRLILGVADDRSVVGVSDPDRLARTVDSVASQNCQPPITILQEIVAKDGRPILVVNVPKGDERPYATNRGVYFIRTTSGRRRASRQELLRLFQSVESLYYDEVPLLKAHLSDISRDAFEHFFAQVYGRPLSEEDASFEDILRNLRLFHNDHPTVAGLLLFGRNPQQFMPHATIEAARIRGSDLATPPADRKSCTGRLPDVFEQADRFLYIHLPIAHEIKGFEPETRPEIPEAALREALVNGLCHRDYTIHGPIRVLIFDDRVEVRTPGTLPNTVTIEAMRLGAAHVPRNPLIYTLFARLGLVTGIGSGVQRLMTLVRRHTGREPDLAQVENEFVVTIHRPGSPR